MTRVLVGSDARRPNRRVLERAAGRDAVSAALVEQRLERRFLKMFLCDPGSTGDNRHMTSTGADQKHSRSLGPGIGLTFAGLALASILLAACGSSHAPSSSTSTTVPTATTQATTTTVAHALSGTAAVISSNWTEFFNGQTSAANKIDLLQNGSTFRSIVNNQASSGLAQSARAKVAAVSDVTTASANVHYAIYLGSTPTLPSVFGVAVKQNGTWKVSDASFCQLLNLEGLRTPACPSKHTGS